MFSHSNNAGNSASAGGGSKQLALSTGERFVEQYYEGFFKSSGGKFYQPTTKVIWNGNGYNGEQFKTTVLPQLQQQLRDFEVTGYDSQSLEVAGSSGPVVVNVSGTVKLDHKERFTQTFIVEKSGSLTYIQSDCFRLV